METGIKDPQDTMEKKRFRLTIEVPIFLVMMASFLSGGAMTNILLYRTCVTSLSRPANECALLLESGPKSNETRQLENESQQYLTIVRMIHSVSEAVVPAIISLFLGTWSNRYGRKPLIMWPVLGVTLSAFATVVYGAIDALNPWWYLVTAVPFALGGGYTTFFTGCFCYITDITTKAERSFRIAFLEAALYSGTILGTIGGPYLLELLGDIKLLLLAATAYTLAFLFIFIYIKESVKGATQGNLSSVLDLTLIKDMMKTCVKKRPNKDRTILVLLIACGTFSVPYTSGLDYLYTRNKLQWSLETHSIFVVVSTLTTIIGLVAGVTLLQKVFKIGDAWLTLLAYLSSIVDFLIKAFAIALWHMYVGTSITLFRGLAHPLVRSILSKIFPVEDTAKIFTLLSILNVTLPLIAPLIFNPLYSATLNVLPGSIYLVCAAIHLANFTMLGFAKYYIWKYPPASEKEPINT